MCEARWKERSTVGRPWTVRQASVGACVLLAMAAGCGHRATRAADDGGAGAGGQHGGGAGGGAGGGTSGGTGGAAGQAAGGGGAAAGTSGSGGMPTDAGNIEAAGDGARGDASDAGGSDAGGDTLNADAHVVDRGAGAQGILLHVANNCAFDLWIQAAGSGVVLEPDNARLAPGAARDYLAPDNWPAARVTAYGTGPGQGELDKVEMTLANKVINYNITYVDWLGLPVEMIAIGSGADCKRVGCYIPQRQVAPSCPEGLLQGSRCLSAGSFCAVPANQTKPLCHALDATIAQCAQDPTRYPGCGQGTTPQVYGCSGFFAGSPKWCAALNRGMIADPDNGDIALYYQTPPYNSYAKWVHAVCPGIYAFPYDDYGKTNESGFHACSGGSQLDITFCPAG